MTNLKDFPFALSSEAIPVIDAAIKPRSIQIPIEFVISWNTEKIV